MTQDELKTLVGQAALEYVPDDAVIGVGTGSTVNKFIEAIAQSGKRIASAVSSSHASTDRLKQLGIKIVDSNSVEFLAVYVDGADEIDPHGNMIKGGGAALTREKIIADLAKQFICIVDESKLVSQLGAFPLPVEVIPNAAEQIIRRFAAMGATANIRLKDALPLLTDNGQYIVDVLGLRIAQPTQMEQTINNWPGVVTVGIFALNRANVALVGCASGVKTICY